MELQFIFHYNFIVSIIKVVVIVPIILCEINLIIVEIFETQFFY